jgi:hypothetical protein
MKNIFFLIILLTVSQLTAQVSGYKGKINTVEVGTDAGINLLAFLAPNVFGILEQGDKMSVPIAIQYERAIKRQRSLKLAMSWTRCKIPTLLDNDKSVVNRGNTFDLTIGYVKYKSNWGLAPIGAYTAFSVGPQFLTAKSGEFNGKTYSASGVNVVLSYARGKRMLISGNLSVDYGIRLITSLGYSPFLSATPILMEGSLDNELTPANSNSEADFKKSLIARTSYVTSFNSGIQVYARVGLVH